MSLKGLHRLRFRTVFIHWVLLFSSAAVQSWLPLSSTSLTEEKVVGETELCGFQERLFFSGSTAITREDTAEIIGDVIGNVIDDVIDDVIEKSVKLTYLYMIFTTIEDKRIQ